MDSEVSNVSVKLSSKKECDIRDSAESSMNQSNISAGTEVHSEGTDVTEFSEGGIMTDEVKTVNGKLQEDSGTEAGSASSTSADESDDSGARTEDGDMEANLFSFASKEWLNEYSKRLPEILSKIAEPHLYRDNKCKFIRIEPGYPVFNPETLSFQVKAGEGKFRIRLDASLYVLKNISVQVIDDKINVAAYHQMEGPFGHEAHEMQQIFPLPESVDKETITAELTTTGTLNIEADLKDLKKTQCVPKTSRKIFVKGSKKSN